MILKYHPPENDKPETSPRHRAQELAFDAMDALHEDPDRASELCRQALDIYPDCVDAIHLLADLESETDLEFMVRLGQAIDAAKRDLGPKFFAENVGHFWGIIETRPFMRAMAARAEILAVDPGTLHQAIEAYEYMLVLNPDDNQGVRYPLLGCYLAARLYDQARKLLAQYDENSALFLWGLVLLDHATMGETEAEATFHEARAANPYAEAFFLPGATKPIEHVGFYSPGEESEAIVCAHALFDAWAAHPKARRWLRELCRKRPNELATLPGLTEVGLSQGSAGLELLLPLVAEDRRDRLAEIVNRIDAFCDANLNSEYAAVCSLLALDVCKSPLAVERGKAESWASGIVWGIGQFNFLTDPSFDPYLSAEDVAAGFGISKGTMHSKWSAIRDALDMNFMDLRWILPSMLPDHPLSRMDLDQNGLIRSFRMLDELDDE